MIDLKHEKYAIKNKNDKNEKTILVCSVPFCDQAYRNSNDIYLHGFLLVFANHRFKKTTKCMAL